MTSDTPSSEQAVIVIEKRNPEGRQRPYKTLRALAKLFTIFAPIIGAVFLIGAGMAWYYEETVADKAWASVQLLVRGIFLYLVLKAGAQMIYLVFDIARGVAKLCEER